MKSFAVLLAGFQLVAAIALPEIEDATAPGSAELSGVYEAMAKTRPSKANSVREPALPHGVFLETQINPSQAATPGGSVSQIKYGPFRIPARGSLENRPSLFMKKPCDNCYIVAMQANLKYASGEVANINEGAWLHHMVMYNNGAKRKDGVCSIMPQRIFASGNERTPVRTNGNFKYGIQFTTGDSLGMIYDLMNESDKAQEYYIEMTYEHVPLNTAGYRPIKMAWLDITGCGISDVPARIGDYDIKSPPWTADFNGRLLSATGHTHDGGADVTIYKNGKPVCKSLQLYARNPSYIGGMMPDMKHISDTGSCVDFGTIKRGDKLHIGAHYNTTEHELNKNMNGRGNAAIMGISQVYMSDA